MKPMNPRARYLLAAFAVVLALALAVPLALPTAPAAQAQEGSYDTCAEQFYAEDDTYKEIDGPRPSEVEGGAEWTIGERTYESHYPNGFTMTIEAESSGGAIVSARVLWQHSPGNNLQRTGSGALDEERGVWVGGWDADRNRNVPPWVLVRYRWEFVDEAGNRYTTQEWDELYEDVERADEWGHLESEDVVVHWLGISDDVGQLVIESMAARREYYCQAWGGLLPYRPRVILFDFSELAAYEVVLNRPAQAGGGITTGTTDGDWGGTVQLKLGRETNADIAYGTVLHEVAHLYQAEFIPALAVDWFNEGNASFFEVARSRSYRNYAYQRLISGDPMSFDIGFSVRGATFRDGYEIGATVFEYLVETYGLDTHRQLWEVIGQGNTRFEGLEIVTGIPIQQFEQEWARWLGVLDYAPPTLVPTPTFAIFDRPTPTFQAPG